ncbi:MAG: hypothetical protein RL333_67 [Pseudomonadota bacterium]|jgi:hypothetical protein
MGQTRVFLAGIRRWAISMPVMAYLKGNPEGITESQS